MRYTVKMSNGQFGSDSVDFDDLHVARSRFVSEWRSGRWLHVEYQRNREDGPPVNLGNWDAPVPLDPVTVDEFKRELKALLDKYEACIGFSVGDSSDCHGLNDERIVITDKLDRELVAVDGYCLQARDLKDS